jgi:ABC-type ATPase involved in cell division
VVDLNDYRQCLTVKRQIGYVAADAAMISNRTLRENLLLTRFYYENDLTIDIDEPVVSLCRDTGLFEKLNQRPSVLHNGELLTAVAIREMEKAPALMLVDRPEDFMELTETDRLFSHLKNIVDLGAAVIFNSRDSKISGLANRQLTLAAGKIRTGAM